MMLTLTRMTLIQTFWLLLGSAWAAAETVMALKTRMPDLSANPARFRSARGIWWVILGALAVALAFKHLHWLPLPLAYLPRQALALGLMLMALGLRYYAIIRLGQWFSTQAVIQPQHCLIEQGPYRYIRHPAYTGLLGAFIAAGIAMGDGLALLALACPLAWALERRMAYEENLLSGHFGPAYNAYRQRTKKWLPWLY